MTCKYPSSELVRYELVISDGVPDGEVKYYGPPPSNRLLASATFENGLLDGKHEAFHPRTGTKVWEGTWKEGRLNGPETGWHLSTGNLFFKAFHKDGKAEGPVVRYAEDGKTVVYRANFEQGLLHGLEEAFDSQSGRLYKAVEWKAGKRHGLAREWNWPNQPPLESQCVEGQCVVTKRPEDARDQAEAAPTNDANAGCVDLWITAHRKEVGPDAAIAAPQIQEWEDWCKESKKPG